MVSATLPSLEPTPAARFGRWIAVLALLVATVLGAHQLAFLCDDAYIHFRYAANAHAGHGLVWNPAPFRPVEGFGFLWVVTLWAIWSWFGVEPPDAANPFLIGCGVLQVLILLLAAHRLRRRDGNRAPVVVGLCAVAMIVTNRTFLQWMSSGLDTALFHVPFLAWVLHAFRAPERRGRTWLPVWATLAAFAALVRPDGLPLVGATIGVTVITVLQRRGRPLAALLGLSPLLLVAAFVLWRHSYYGEWLPNTYYAKVAAAWPEAGARYFACFALENGLWLWVPVVVTWLVVQCRRGIRPVCRTLWHHVPALAAVGVTVFNAAYYCLVVGGDHFEYRVLSQLVPLGVLGCVAMVTQLTNGVRWPLLVALALGLAGSGSWVHLALTRDPSSFGIKAISPQLPALVRPLTRWFDRQQAWLFLRYIGLRSTHHRVLLQMYQQTYPRRLTIENPPDPFPMLATGAVGLPSWCLPDCAILDEFGLNDWVIARTKATFGEPMTAERLRPAVLAADADKDGFLVMQELTAAVTRAVGDAPRGGPTSIFVFQYLMDVCSETRPDAVTIDEATAMSELINTGRMMAHEHQAPLEYYQAFEPNVSVTAGIVTVRPRQVPLTAERIRAIEAEWAAKVRAH